MTAIRGKSKNRTLGLRLEYKAVSFHSASLEMSVSDSAVWEVDFILNKWSLLQIK